MDRAKEYIKMAECYMTQTMPFGEVLDAVDQLSLEDQATLVAILQRRLAQAGRQQIVADVQEASQQFTAGQCKPTSPEELLREIMG